MAKKKEKVFHLALAYYGDDSGDNYNADIFAIEPNDDPIKAFQRYSEFAYGYRVKREDITDVFVKEGENQGVIEDKSGKRKFRIRLEEITG